MSRSGEFWRDQNYGVNAGRYIASKRLESPLGAILWPPEGRERQVVTMRRLTVIVVAMVLLLAAGIALAIDVDPTQGVQDPPCDVSAPERKLAVAENQMGALREENAQLRQLAAQGREAASKAGQAEARGDHAEAERQRKIVVHDTQIIRQSLTPAEFTEFMKNYGGSATWGKEEVQQSLNSGLLVGRETGSKPSDNEWQSPATREELATGLNRGVRQSKDYSDAAVKTHDKDSNAHAGLVVGLRKEIAVASLWGKIAFWALVALVVLWLIDRLFGWLMRRRGAGGAPAIGAVPPVAPSGGVGGGVIPALAAFVPFSLGITRRVRM